MLKQVNYLIFLGILILMPSLQAVSKNGKSFFSPQSLSFMTSHCNMEPSAEKVFTPSFTSLDLSPEPLIPAPLPPEPLPYSHKPYIGAQTGLHERSKIKRGSYTQLSSGLIDPQEHKVELPERKPVVQRPALPARYQSPLIAEPRTRSWTFDATPFFIQSMNGDDLRHYFFPDGKDALIIKGSQLGGDYDISGTWLKIVGANTDPTKALFINSFQSTLQVNPTYKYFGFNLHAHKKIQKLWIDMQLPVAKATVNHGLSEYGISGNKSSLDMLTTYLGVNTGSPNHDKNRVEATNILFSTNASEAFGNASWKYHKLSSSTLTAYGLGDTSIKIGYDLADYCKVFGKCVLPTSQSAANAFMFEPILGNNGHYGLGIGAQFNKESYINAVDGRFNLAGESDLVYLFDNNQMRTFDINAYGPFSRFLLFKKYQGAGFDPSYPGVNTLTKNTTVSPLGEFNTHLHLLITRKNMEFGLDYSCQLTPSESLTIDDSFDDTFAVSNTLGENANSHFVYFFDDPTIAKHGNTNPVTTPKKNITLDDLNTDCAARPATASSLITLSAGMKNKWEQDEFSIKIIGGVVINHTSSALNTWLIALQCGVRI